MNLINRIIDKINIIYKYLFIQYLSKKSHSNIVDAVNKYNNLILMSKEIVSSNKDIQIREMSEGFNKTIDTLKISEEPRLILKK